MKLLSLCLMAALALAAPASAQYWTGTLKIGGAVTEFSGELSSGPVEWETRTGLAAGGGVGYDFGNGFVPQVEFTYVRKGAAADVDFQGIPARIRSDLTYLEIPLLLQYRFDTRAYVHPRLFAGPMAAYRLDSHISFRAQGDDVEVTEQDDSIENLDLGAMAGGALEVEWGGQRLSFEARLVFGTADITKPDDQGRNPTLRNRGLEFFVGFVF